MRGVIQLSMTSVGSGLPVVGLHGFGPDHRLMSGLLEPVFQNRPGYRRVYLDLPGCGGSPSVGVNSTGDIVDVLDGNLRHHLGQDPFVLVGESYGGYLPRELTRRHPSQVLGMALVCPVAVPSPTRRILPAHEGIAGDEAFLATLADDERESFTSISVVQTAEQYVRFRDEIACGLAITDAPALDRIQQRYALDHWPEDSDRYTGPTLIIAGRQDSVVGYVDQWGLLEHYPRATFTVLDRAGHNGHLEQAGLVNALLNEWLDRVEEHHHL